MDSTYNGWANYETWAVNLWLSNNPGDQEWIDELAADAWSDAFENHDPAWLIADLVTFDEVWTDARYYLAERLRAELEDAMPDLGATLWGDLLNSAFSEVAWQDIAAAYLPQRQTVEASQ